MQLHHNVSSELQGPNGEPQVVYGLEGFNKEAVQVYLKGCAVRADLQPLKPSEQPAPQPIVVERAFQQMQVSGHASWQHRCSIRMAATHNTHIHLLTNKER